MIKEAVYTPSAWQQEAHACPVDEMLGAGSAGVGKTLFLITDPIQQIQVEHERCVARERWAKGKGPKPLHGLQWGASVGWGIHLRRELIDLQQTMAVAARIYRAVDPHAKWDAQNHTWIFKSGYRLTFGHCQNLDSHTRYLSFSFCLAEGQRVVMADGSLRAIESVVAGEMVMTLEGPRRVTATWDTGEQHCSALDVLHPTTGDLIGTQIHPTTHPVLLSSSDESPPSASPGSPHSGAQVHGREVYWQDFESHLDGVQVILEKRASTIDDQSCFVGSDDSRREVQQLPSLSVQPVLHEPTFRSALDRVPSGSRAGESHCSRCLLTRQVPPRRHEPSPVDQQRASEASPQELGRESGTCACGGDCARPGSGTATDSTGYCSRSPRLRGEPPPPEAESGQEPPLRQAGAGGRSPVSCSADGPDSTRGDSRTHPEPSYPHFYSGEVRALKEAVCIGVGTHRYHGVCRTYDLTVEGANHYIGEFGVVNKQTWIGFDELRTFALEQYDGVTSRLRTSDPVLLPMLRIRACTNPGSSPGSDPLWVRKLWIDPCPEGRRILTRKIRMSDGTFRTRTRMFLPGRLADNPDPLFRETYEITLQDKPRHIREAYLNGDWYYVAGSYFGDDFLEDVHRVMPFVPPSDWPVWRAMDWGFKTAGIVGWFTMDEDGNEIQFAEWWFSGQTDREVAEVIKFKEQRLGLWDDDKDCSLLTGPADTQLWEKRGEHDTKTKAETFAEMGIDWVPADKADRAGNAQRVLRRMRDHRNRTTFPGLSWTSDCVRTIKAIRTIPTKKEPDGTPGEEPQKGGEDHPVDMVMYSCAYASRGRDAMPTIRRGRSILDEIELHRHKGAKHSNGTGYGSQYG